MPFLVVFGLLFSCQKELAKEPNQLIEKDKMVNIMYDLSLLDAMKIQNSIALDSFTLNSNEYIYKKYKIDSVQFAQSNIYYAADYKEYTKIVEKVKERLDQNKSVIDSLIKVEKKKEKQRFLIKKKLKLKREKDSIKKVKQAVKLKKESDSIKKVKNRNTIK